MGGIGLRPCWRSRRTTEWCGFSFPHARTHTRVTSGLCVSVWSVFLCFVWCVFSFFFVPPTQAADRWCKQPRRRRHRRRRRVSTRIKVILCFTRCTASFILQGTESWLSCSGYDWTSQSYFSSQSSNLLLSRKLVDARNGPNSRQIAGFSVGRRTRGRNQKDSKQNKLFYLVLIAVGVSG